MLEHGLRRTGEGVTCRTIEVSGHPREFIVYVPRKAVEQAPVVFMFHGSSGTGGQFLRISGWREQADATGLVAVFPTGLRYRVLAGGRLSTKWNDGELASEVDLDERPPGYPAAAPWPADDVGFFDAMLTDLSAHLSIDPHRIYASGFSSGANFVARLAVERSTVLAAAAFSAGGLSAARSPDRPTPMYATAGTLDDRILARTGPPPLDRRYAVRAQPNSTSLRWPAEGPGPGGAVFRFSLLAGLGHSYANGGNNPGGFAAAPEFWTFFAHHPLP